MLNKKAESLENDGLFYVFVNLNGLDTAPSYHVVSSAVVAEYCRRTHREWLEAPGRGGHQRMDSNIRKFWDRDDKWKDRWDVLGLEEAVYPAVAQGAIKGTTYQAFEIRARTWIFLGYTTKTIACA